MMRGCVLLEGVNCTSGLITLWDPPRSETHLVAIISQAEKTSSVSVQTIKHLLGNSVVLQDLKTASWECSVPLGPQHPGSPTNRTHV